MAVGDQRGTRQTVRIDILDGALDMLPDGHDLGAIRCAVVVKSE